MENRIQVREEAKAAIKELTEAIENAYVSVWKVAELAAYYKERLGELWYGVCEEVGKRTNQRPETIDKYGYLYAQAEREGWLLRKEGLTIGHHNVVARRGLSADERRALLVLAAERRLSVADLKVAAQQMAQKSLSPGSGSRDLKGVFLDEVDWRELEGRTGKVCIVDDSVWLYVRGKFYFVRELGTFD
jgi:hypothetical protein